MNTLVLGVGNLLMQDEGAGVRALEAFADKYPLPDGVEFLDGGTSGLGLLQHLDGRDCLVIIDAVRSGERPGTVVRMEGQEVPALFRQRISAHQLGIADLLAMAQLTGSLPGKLVLLGIEPKTMGTGLTMSMEVLHGLNLLVDMLAQELGKHNANLAAGEV
jgi:hydrogenase maturation protease